jgi:hypothetical protein
MMNDAGSSGDDTMDSKAYQSEAVAATLGQIAGAEPTTAISPPSGSGWVIRSNASSTGANRGQSASLHAVFPAATIHSFEANPIFFPC